MEEKVFRHPAVAGELQRMIEARLHNDHPDSETRGAIKELQQRMADTLATPTYVVVDPRDGEIVARHVGPEYDADEFAAWLRRARERAGG